MIEEEEPFGTASLNDRVQASVDNVEDSYERKPTLPSIV